jgi:dihydroflavonol-4-reductase
MMILMKIAVTGATGHIGVNLCRLLLEEGFRVKAFIHNINQGLENLPLEFCQGDVTRVSDLENLFDGCEVVFHLAAFISLKKNDPVCYKINTEGCSNVLQAARKTSVRRIIHFSSIHAFNELPIDNELDEGRALALESPMAYNRSKALGQKLMLESSSAFPEIIVLNPTAVIGPNDYKPSFLGNALIRFYKGQNPGLVPGGYNWVDVRDICRAAVNAIQYGKPGESYLLGGNWRSLKELIHLMEQYGGKGPPLMEWPFWMAQAAAPFLNLHSRLRKKPPLYTSMSLKTLKYSHHNISSDKARSSLGFTPRSFAETIEDTIAWFKEHHYL